MENDYIIRQEKPTDYEEVENLTREAFWNVYRPGCLEHYVLHEYRLRNDFLPRLDYVLEKNGRIIAHVMYARSYITESDGNKIEIATFGPLSVLPEEQRKGYGSKLLSYTLDLARKQGIKAVAITGNYDFYRHLGFEKGKDKGIFYSFDRDADYFLIKELSKGFFDTVKGEYADPDGYFVDEKDADEFDKKFTPKRKIKTDSQL